MALKSFYRKNAVIKHIWIFLITAIISFVSVYFQLLAETAEKAEKLPDFPLKTFLIALTVMIVIGIYLGGYNFQFMHNAFNSESDSVLPEFTGKPFNIFWKAFPLMLVWTLYIIAATALCFHYSLQDRYSLQLVLFYLLDYCLFLHLSSSFMSVMQNVIQEKDYTI